MPRVPLLCCAALLLASSCGTVRHQVPVVHERQVRIDVPPPEGLVPALEVVLLRGFVLVEPGDRLSGSVEASVTASSEEDAERHVAGLAPRVALDPATGRIVLSLSHPEGASLASVSATFRLRVPATTALTVRTESGDVACRGYGGNLTVDTRSGDVDVTMDGGSAELGSQRGRIRLRGEFAAASLHNESGRTEVVVPGGGNAFVDVQQGSGPLLFSLRELQRMACAATGEVRGWTLDPGVVAEWTETRVVDDVDLQVGSLGDPLGLQAGDLQVRALGTVRVSLVRLPTALAP